MGRTESELIRQQIKNTFRSTPPSLNHRSRKLEDPDILVTTKMSSMTTGAMITFQWEWSNHDLLLSRYRGVAERLITVGRPLRHW
jgi:hypothetical protein